MTQPEGELRAAIVQDAETGRVLMLAWMDDEAERRTRESGEAWFWSRCREEYWHKGATSGNTMAVEELRDDCDGDALLVRVRPNGPACHTGSLSCFAPALWRTISERARAAARGLVHDEAAERGHAGVRAEGRRGGGRGRPRRARRVGRAARRGVGRPDLPPVRAARLARRRHRRGRGRARASLPLTARREEPRRTGARGAGPDASVAQPMRVLPNSTRKSTLRPVAASVNCSSTRLCVPSPFFWTTYDQPGARSTWSRRR